MKIDKRYVVGIPMMLIFLPVILIGFLANWLHMYYNAGYEIGEISYDYINNKLGD